MDIHIRDVRTFKLSEKSGWLAPRGILSGLSCVTLVPSTAHALMGLGHHIFPFGDCGKQGILYRRYLLVEIPVNFG